MYSSDISTVYNCIANIENNITSIETTLERINNDIALIKAYLRAMLDAQ